MKRFIKQIINVYFRGVTLTERQVRQLQYYIKVILVDDFGSSIEHKTYEELMFDDEAKNLVKGGNDYMWGVKCYANAFSYFVSPSQFKKIVTGTSRNLMR